MAKAKFAKDTTVDPQQSLMEIRRIVSKYKASDFAMGENARRVTIAFEMCNRRIRFSLPLPDKDSKEFRYGSSGATWNKGQFSQKMYDQAIRQKWRALALTIKAKLESYDSGIETFEEAFMAQMVLANGQTMAEWAAPQVEAIYGNGNMPPLLGSGI